MQATGECRLKLFHNIQFLYELHLATLELESFGVRGEMSADYRAVTVTHGDGDGDGNSDDTVRQLLKRAAYVGAADGAPSDYTKLTQHNLTRAFNQYITHWFYPYKGKYHPQMVRALANIIGLRDGDVLLDPFIGSGTTAVEGALLNLNVVGFDVSPLCVLISEVKANAMHHFAAIKKSTTKTPAKTPAEQFELLAKMISTSDSVRRRRNFDEMLIKNRTKMLNSVQAMIDACDEVNISPPPAKIKIGDARKLPLADNSIDGVITSPPYSLALNYVENDAHSLESLGYDTARIREEFIGVRGRGVERIELYERDMSAAYGEIARTLKPAAKAAIVIGDATLNGEKIPTAQNAVDTFKQLGCELIHNVDKLIYGLYNVMQRESILIFQKGGNND